jgi:glutathione synthase/RimK-type ligase-like ATP-grasp enzyme
MATDRCTALEDPWGDHAVPVSFEDADASAAILADLLPPLDGVIAVNDRATEVAAKTAERLGLRFHSPAATAVCRNKFLTRAKLRDAGLPVPDFQRYRVDADSRVAAAEARYPCVLKPLGLSASRGVIRQ